VEEELSSIEGEPSSRRYLQLLLCICKSPQAPRQPLDDGDSDRDDDGGDNDRDGNDGGDNDGDGDDDDS
jgi:hypothetical protein